jgi:hypothetical protein
VASVSLAGTVFGSGTTYATAGTVVTRFIIPGNAPAGPQTIVVTFGGPTYTMTGAFTLN